MAAGGNARAAALVSAAALGVHELRYLVGGSAEHGGHGYLGEVVPVIAALVLLAAARFLAALIRAVAGGPAESRGESSHAVRWVPVSALLLAVYVGQESTEAALTSGPGLDAVTAAFGHGGWTVLIFAPAMAGVVAVLLGGAEVALSAAARRSTRPSAGRLRPGGRRRLPAVIRPRAHVLAAHAAGRGPPGAPS